MAKSPDAVELREKICFRLCDVRAEVFLKIRADARAPLSEGELRFLADAAIGMPEETEEFFGRAGVHSLAQQAACFGDDLVGAGFGMADAVDAAPTGLGPS